MDISFTLKRLVIHSECSEKVRKNLHPAEYLFNSQVEKGFFGTNITVETIVGENGSGKSTLLELMFRMINNLAAMMFCRVECSAADELKYVLGIYADLEYSIGGKDIVLKVRDTTVTLVADDKKVCFGNNGIEEFNGFEDYTNASEQKIFELTSSFFYTIVTNYSVQAYVASDYSEEKCLVYDRKKKCWKKDKGTWINSLFHKNDGYMCPINLNPYRDDGTINMHNETALTMYRITSLLIEFSRGAKHGQYLHGYELRSIEYKLDSFKLIKGFKSVNAKESGIQKLSRILDAFKKACKRENRNSAANLILGNFQVPLAGENDDNILWMARLYLVCKVLSIADKYPMYQKFKAISNLEIVLCTEVPLAQKGMYKKLAKHVKDDKSHIGIKVWQTVFFLSRFKNVPDTNNLYKKFTYDQYEEWLGNPHIEQSVYDRMYFLPPSLFSAKVILKKVDENGRTKGIVPFNRLSSGERQFMFTTSAILYHLLNLRSVRKGRPCYRCFNIVLDEVELCFHPEYQRTFIFDFLRIVSLLGFQDRCSLNILITTHSPFILSDVPSTNILYLKDGHPEDKSSLINPFAANVNDILRQSFFLENGFIGKFAQRKIKRLVTFLSTNDEKRNDYNMDLAPALIEKVGDPLLKRTLYKMLDEFYVRNPQVKRHDEKEVSKEERIAELKRELEKLERED
jgi:hypothetical protein bfra3_06227